MLSTKARHARSDPPSLRPETPFLGGHRRGLGEAGRGSPASGRKLDGSDLWKWVQVRLIRVSPKTDELQNFYSRHEILVYLYF